MKLFRSNQEVVVLANIEVTKQLTLAQNNPLPISVGPGQEVILEVPYRIKEVSRHYEEATLRLRSRCGQRQHDPAVASFEDRIGRLAGKRGTLKHRWSWSMPGTHTIEAVVEAERRIKMWNSGQTIHSEKERVAVRLVVHVEA